jgi:hypothetical protein
MQKLTLVLAEQVGECLLHEIDPLEQKPHIQLLLYLLPALVQGLHGLPIGLQTHRIEQHVHDVAEEDEEVELLGRDGLVLIVVVEVRTGVDLEGVFRVLIHEQQRNQHEAE